MNYTFPIPDVKIKQTLHSRKPESPLFDDGFFCVNEKETAVNVEGIATYYTREGNKIDIVPKKGVDKHKINHFLNSWGVVSILHQRKIINFHASSFNFKNKGIMVCGDSGTGKSSLTAAFCLNDAEFISDDISPVIFKNDKPHLWSIPGQMMLRKETLNQLDLKNQKPVGINPFNQKFSFNFNLKKTDSVPLTHVLWLAVDTVNKVVFKELSGPEKFAMLRGEICGWEMLKGMRETEVAYMKNLIDISSVVKITKIIRPDAMGLMKLYKLVNDYLRETI